MRIKTNQTKNHGSVLLVTLSTAWVIGIALVSYLTLVANQNRTTYHSQSWSACIPVLEAGIEEALTQLNYNDGEGLNNAEAHGWTAANGLYTKSRVVNANEASYYEVTIDPNTNGTPATPIITSKGYVPAPGKTGTPMGGETAFGMILATVTVQSTPAMICRTVRVGTTVENAVAAKGGINTKGTILFSGGGSLDSFDSSNSQYSTLGRYDVTKRKANGIAMSNSSLADAIHVGTGYVYGSIITGAGPLTGPNATVTVDGGAIGDAGYNASPIPNPDMDNKNIQAGHSANDANLQFDAVVEPYVYGSGSFPVSGAVAGYGTTNFTYVLNAASNTRFNLPGGVNLGGGKSMIVTGGDVTLYVNGNFTTSGSGYVYIAPGASLKLYVAATLTVSGTGVVNGGGYAHDLSIYGLGTVKQNWAYSGSSAFIGTVYSPYDQFTFSGGAGAFGSFTANNVVISGGAAVHYDESLGGNTNREYIACSWNEI